MVNEKDLLLFENDALLEELENYLSTTKLKESEKFNIFKILKLDNYEIRHSNFVAWLLDPNGSHKLGDKFLIKFINKALNLDIACSDDIKIETEYCTDEGRRIDILIYSEKSKFVCVIENKYGTDEHDAQCEHYKNYIEELNNFENYSYNYIFLDIKMPNPEDFEKRLQGYKPILYSDVKVILEELLATENIDNQVRATIEQYVEVLKEKYPMTDKHLVNLCTKLYSKHKDAIDALVKYSDAKEVEFSELLYDIVLSNSELVPTGYHNKEFIEFFSKDIVSIYKYKNYSDDKSLRVYFLFYQKNRKIDFILWISRGTLEDRQKAYDILKENFALLENKGIKLNKFTSKKVEKPVIIEFLSEDEYTKLEDLDTEDIKAELLERFNKIYSEKIKILLNLYSDNISKLPRN